MSKEKTNSNSNLHKAGKAKKDEFYIQLVDIEKGLKCQKEQFKKEGLVKVAITTK